MQENINKLKIQVQQEVDNLLVEKPPQGHLRWAIRAGMFEAFYRVLNLIEKLEENDGKF